MQYSQTGCFLKLQLPGPLPSPDVSYPLRVGPETSVFLANSLGDSVAASPVPKFGDHRFKPAMVTIRKLKSREGNNSPKVTRWEENDDNPPLFLGGSNSPPLDSSVPPSLWARAQEGMTEPVCQEGSGL